MISINLHEALSLMSNKDMSTFIIQNNQDINLYEIPPIVERICLDSGTYVDLSKVKWPPHLKYFKCNFRPTLTHGTPRAREDQAGPTYPSVFPDTLEELHFVTQHEVWRKDLPRSLKRLILEAPNSNPTTFELDPVNPDIDDEIWECEFFYISIDGFGKYNKFKRSLFDSECDNIGRYMEKDPTFFNYQVDGDPII